MRETLIFFCLKLRYFSGKYVCNVTHEIRVERCAISYYSISDNTAILRVLS